MLFSANPDPTLGDATDGLLEELSRDGLGRKIMAWKAAGMHAIGVPVEDYLILSDTEP